MTMVDQQETTEATETTCTHYWLIETPSGPYSQGVCRYCGEERSFRNYIESSYWEDDVTVEEVSAGARYAGGAGRGRKRGPVPAEE